MAEHRGTNNGLRSAEDVTVRFSDRFTQSSQFKAMFEEGMTLVEETAAYLDGEGRAESRTLSRSASLVYATESMRLTTRLMQLASWLLLHRAVNEGELTMAEASSEKRKVRLQALNGAPAGSGFDELPEKMHELIDRSLKLYSRIISVDKMMYTKAPTPRPRDNAIQGHMEQLQAAFGNDEEA